MSEKKIILETDLKKRLRSVSTKIPDTYLFVNIQTQLLSLIEYDTILKKYPVSTSKHGTGNKADSFQTPLGIHRITEKIGSGSPAGRIFKDRKDTGENWDNSITDNGNLILTRILRLEGLEDDVNRGQGIDSYGRYIYIHGTNKEKQLGTPNSHGCICMRSIDIIELFDRIPENTIVIIN